MAGLLDLLAPVGDRLPQGLRDILGLGAPAGPSPGFLQSLSPIPRSPDGMLMTLDDLYARRYPNWSSLPQEARNMILMSQQMDSSGIPVQTANGKGQSTKDMFPDPLGRYMLNRFTPFGFDPQQGMKQSSPPWWAPPPESGI